MSRPLMRGLFQTLILDWKPSIIKVIPYLKEHHSVLFLSVLVMFTLNLFSFNMLFNRFQSGEFRTGLIISKNDGRQYDRMSDYLVKEGKFLELYTQEGYHSSLFYRGFVFLVALIKKWFGSSWHEVFIFINGFLICCTVFISSKLLSPNRHVFAVFLVSILLIVSNLQIINYTWVLLPDLVLAMCVSISFVLVAIGIGKENKQWFISGLLIVLLSMFIRPNGIFAVTIILGLCVFWLLPKRKRQLIAVLVPPIIGLSVFIIVTLLTSLIASDPSLIGSMPPPFNKILEQMLELNYFGDNIAHETFIGTLIINFPYKYWIATNGSWPDLVSSMFIRFIRIFELSNPAAPKSLNLYNIVYYTTLFSTFVLYVVSSIRSWSKDSSHMILLSCFFGYFLIFLSLSMIETRFLLVFDMIMIIGSAIAIQSLFFMILSSRKKNLILF